MINPETGGGAAWEMDAEEPHLLTLLIPEGLGADFRGDWADSWEPGLCLGEKKVSICCRACFWGHQRLNVYTSMVIPVIQASS